MEYHGEDEYSQRCIALEGREIYPIVDSLATHSFGATYKIVMSPR